MRRTEFLQALVYAAIIDGPLDERERELLATFGARLRLELGVQQQVVAACVQAPRWPPQMPADEPTRLQLFRCLRTILLCDGEIAPAERELLLFAGQELAIPADTIEAVLARGEALTASEASGGEAAPSLGLPPPVEAPAPAPEARGPGHSTAEGEETAASFLREDYFTYLVHAALADGQITDPERAALEKYGRRLGLDQEVMDGIVTERVGASALPLVVPKSAEERKTLFRTILKVTGSDGIVSSNERRMLRAVGKQLEVPKAQVAAALAHFEATAGTSLDAPREKPMEMMRILFHVAAADGVIAAPERKALLTYGRKLGLREHELEPLFAEAAKGRMPLGDWPEKEWERRVLFQATTTIVVADGEVSEPERALMLRLGGSVGFDVEDVEAHLSEALEGIEAARQGMRLQGARSIRRRDASAPKRAAALIGAIAVLIALVGGAATYSLARVQAPEVASISRQLEDFEASPTATAAEAIAGRIARLQDEALFSRDVQAAEALARIWLEREAQAQASLSDRAEALLASGLEGGAQARDAERLCNSLRGWRERAPELAARGERLAEALSQANARAAVLGGLAELALSRARLADSWLLREACDASADEPARDPAGHLARQLRDARRRSGHDILAALSDPSHHAVLAPEDYTALSAAASAAKAELGGDWPARLTRFESQCLALRGISQELRAALALAGPLARKGQPRAAASVLRRARASRDPWFLRVAGWLEDPATIRRLEAQRPAEVPPETPAETPTVAPVAPPLPPEPPTEPAPPPAEPAPAASVAEAGNYKEEVVAALALLRRDRDAGLAALLGAMNDSLTLIPESPAMAWDVLRFYESRRKRLPKDERVAAAYEAHLRAGVEVILPSCTGPFGFGELRSLLKRLGDDEGCARLDPILARFTPPKPQDPRTAARHKARLKSREVQESLRRFLGERRAAYAEELEALARASEPGAFGGALGLAIERLIAQVGRRPALARELQALLAAPAPSGAEPPPARRLEALLDGAEDDFLDATQKAIDAGEPGIGFDLLQDALIIAPQSRRAYKGLRYQRVGEDWLRPWEARLRKRGLSYDDEVGWHPGAREPGRVYDLEAGRWQDLAAADARHAEPGDPWVLISEHFELRSTAPRAESEEVLRRLEAFYLQLFRQFDLFFAPDGDPIVVFGLATKAPMVVHYYRSREQFLTHSEAPGPGVAGFYDPNRKASYFYSLPGDWTTLQHEVVHQILGENSTGGRPEKWIVEGTACYMEDAAFDEGGRLSLGRVLDHLRARFYWQGARAERPPISGAGLLALESYEAWDRVPPSQSYTGAGAMVTFLMTFDDGAWRSSFLEHLRDGYVNQRPDLEVALGMSKASLAWLFERFYAQGFVARDGAWLSQDEARRRDAEDILRRFPDPEGG